MESVQVNTELKKIMKSYHSLRQTWEEEKTNLQIQITLKKLESIEPEKMTLENSTNVFADINDEKEEEQSSRKNNRFKRKSPLPSKDPEDLKTEEDAQLNRLKKTKNYFQKRLVALVYCLFI